MYQNKTVTAIINCAGLSIRFGVNKLTQKINGEYIILKTIKRFVLPEIDQLIVTVSQKYWDEYQQILIEDEKLPVELVLGGAERYLSALNGIKATQSDIIILHDGVRPFVKPELIRNLLAATVKHQAAMLAIPATTTIKVSDSAQFIKKSLLRTESWLAQTPQAFTRKVILSAYEKALAQNYQIVSDDSEVVSNFTRQRVKIVPGDEANIKLTFQQDLAIAQVIDQNFGKWTIYVKPKTAPGNWDWSSPTSAYAK